MRARWAIIKSDPYSGRTARAGFRVFIGTRRLGAQAFDLELAFGELITNAVKHGRDPISASVKLNGNVLSIHVEDAGPGFDLNSTNVADRAFDRGRGLGIVRAVAEDVYAQRTEHDCFRVGATIRLWDAPFGLRKGTANFVKR